MIIPWASQQGGAPAPPNPIAVSDFKNGIYSIGGVPKVLADLYTPGFTFPGDSATIGIIANQGFEVDWVGGGVGTSASATYVATAGLDAVLDPVLGYSGVIDVSAVLMHQPPSVFFAELIWPGGGDNFATIGISAYGPDYDEQYVLIRTGVGDATVYQGIVDAESGDNYRIAFSISAAGLSASVNGGGIVSSAPYPANYTVGFTPRPFVSITRGAPATIGGNSIFKGVTYYPLLTDMQLRALST